KCPVFVLPSHSEGVPKALLEAMSQGMHCIIDINLALQDEIRAHATQIPLSDWSALERELARLRLEPRNRRNIEFAHCYLRSSEQALERIYEAIYSREGVLRKAEVD